jgi:hypothetical protein
MDLKDLVNSMIAEVRADKARPKPKRAPKEPATAPAVPIDPWTHTAVVLLTTHTTCRACNESMICCEPHLYAEMHKGSRKRGTYVRRLERITNYTGKWYELYAALPKRTEPRLQEVDACPWCFGLDADNTGLHYNKPLPTQLELELC